MRERKEKSKHPNRNVLFLMEPANCLGDDIRHVLSKLCDDEQETLEKKPVEEKPAQGTRCTVNHSLLFILDSSRALEHGHVLNARPPLLHHLEQQLLEVPQSFQIACFFQHVGALRPGCS